MNAEPLSPEELEKKLFWASQKIQEFRQELSKKIVGQEHVALRLLMAMLSGGHVLLEGMPGLAKTTIIKSLAEIAQLTFKRVQFTPDLLPADVMGTQIYDPRTGEFLVKKGPVFTNLLLADEINRAPAKVQAALLEAMEEKQVTIGDKSWVLEEPFLVMATQNPVEQEGTYPLPEAQVDRFLFKLLMSYGSTQDEEEILKRALTSSVVILNKIASQKDILLIRQLAEQIYVADKIRTYIVQIIFATREPKKSRLSDLAPLIEYGASPRASLAIQKVARVNALMEGRHFVTPQDVKDVAFDCLRHRIKLTYEAEAERISADDVIKKILDRIDVP